MIRALAARRAQLYGAQGNEDRAILSFVLLLSLILSGFVFALGQAEPNPSLVHHLTILN